MDRQESSVPIHRLQKSILHTHTHTHTHIYYSLGIINEGEN